MDLRNSENLKVCRRNKSDSVSANLCFYGLLVISWSLVRIRNHVIQSILQSCQILLISSPIKINKGFQYASWPGCKETITTVLSINERMNERVLPHCIWVPAAVAASKQLHSPNDTKIAFILFPPSEALVVKGFQIDHLQMLNKRM